MRNFFYLTEVETAFVYIDSKGIETGRFVFRNGQPAGQFITAGKEVKVTPIK